MTSEYEMPETAYMKSEAQTGEFDIRGDKSASTAVVRAVSTAKDVEPENLPPIYDYIDPEALDELFQKTNRRPIRGNTTVSFEYCGYTVAVRAVGTVELH